MNKCAIYTKPQIRFSVMNVIENLTSIKDIRLISIHIKHQYNIRSSYGIEPPYFAC